MVSLFLVQFKIGYRGEGKLDEIAQDGPMLHQEGETKNGMQLPLYGFLQKGVINSRTQSKSYSIQLVAGL